MKIRKGFVSNSSSSSFIVAFPKKIEKLQDVIDPLFRDEPFAVCDHCGENTFDSLIAANEVFRRSFDKQHVCLWKRGAKESTDVDWDMPLTEKQVLRLAREFRLEGDPNIFKELNTLDRLLKSMGLPTRSENKKVAKAKDLQKVRKMERALWKDTDRRTDKNHKEIIKKFFKENKGKFVYIYEWDDKDPLSFAMETGEIFRKLPHIYINNH